MISFVVTFVFSTAVYWLLTAGSGAVLRLWSREELVAGLFFGAVTALIARRYFCARPAGRIFNPLRLLLGIGYALGPFFVEMAKANLDVAFRVITLKIRPGIVRVKSGMTTDLGTLMLANSITLTPGTLTVDIDESTNDLFVHMINVPPGVEQAPAVTAESLFSFHNCPATIRRIAE